MKPIKAQVKLCPLILFSSIFRIISFKLGLLICTNCQFVLIYTFYQFSVPRPGIFHLFHEINLFSACAFIKNVNEILEVNLEHHPLCHRLSGDYYFSQSIKNYLKNSCVKFHLRKLISSKVTPLFAKNLIWVHYTERKTRLIFQNNRYHIDNFGVKMKTKYVCLHFDTVDKYRYQML